MPAALRVRRAHVDRLEALDGAEVARERHVEARARDVALVVVRRHDGAAAARASRGSGRRRPDAERPRLELEVVRRDARGPATNTSRRRASITGQAPGCAAASASSVETPAPGSSSASAEPARERESDSRAGEAARARCRRRARRGRPASSLPREQRVDVLEQRARRPDALAEHAPVVDERARRDVGRGVEGEDEHQRNAF